MRSRPTTAHQNGAVVAQAGRPVWMDWLAVAVICMCEAMGANACRACGGDRRRRGCAHGHQGLGREREGFDGVELQAVDSACRAPRRPGS